MPDVIDNVKVGEYIKTLLKKNHMTQDDLAQKLNISKSAVSQNLRGKSTFDIQNMIRIAEIFNITLDDLLSLKTTQEEGVISEYQKVVNQGLIAFKATNADNLRVNQPDMYGKVLVDYIIESKHLEMFEYLKDNDVSLVEDHYHRSRDIYLDVIVFMLEQNISGVFNYIQKYKELNRTFLIHDELYKLKIWGLLNQTKYQDIVEEIFRENIKDNQVKSFFNKMQDPGYLSKTDMIDVIANYKLRNIFETYLNIIYKDSQFSYIVKEFVRYGYEEGIELLIHEAFKKPLVWIKKVSMEVQASILEVVKLENEKLILEFIDKKLYTDLTQVTLLAIKKNLNKVTSHVINNYHSDLNFRKVGESCIDANNKVLLEDISKYFNQNDYDYFLSYTNEEDISMMIYLIKHGAKIDEKYYNLKTFQKMNILIKYLLDEGDEK
jgi:transcriptional regulator with XRE-family HTH domain